MLGKLLAGERVVELLGELPDGGRRRGGGGVA